MANLSDELTLVTVGYNSAAVLPLHFKSYLDSATTTLPRWVFVDNNSADATGKLMETFSNSIEYLRNSENIGFGAACNVGINAAVTRYVLVLNPDTVLSEKAVTELLLAMKQHDAAIVGPKLKVSDKTGAHVVDWLVGAVLLFDRKKMDSIGYFDERFFLYREDADLCKRATDAGLKVLQCNDVSIPHVGGGSTRRTRSVNYFVHFHRGRSHVLYARKHGLPEAEVERYIAKNRKRCLIAALTFGARRFVRAKAKLDGARSAK